MDIQLHIEQVDCICNAIEDGREYMEKLTAYLPELSKLVNTILDYSKEPENSFAINEQFVLQVLKDIIYGIEHKDVVFLLDVLRYGLLEIYDYVMDELQSEE